MMKITNALLSTIVFLVLLPPQALAAPPGPPGAHLNVTQVLVDDPNNPTSIMIIGTDLDFGSGPLSVTLGNANLTVIATVDVTPTDTYIEALLPDDLPAGDYLLTVSMGNGQSQNDEYDLTIGAVGPAGPAGEDGADGAPGADGADGADGMDGLPGMAGVDGLPGADGADGMNGADGPPGPPGKPGMTGADGQDGQDGARGPRGFQGIQGTQGPQGPAGLSAFPVPFEGDVTLTSGQRDVEIADTLIGKFLAHCFPNNGQITFSAGAGFGIQSYYYEANGLIRTGSVFNAANLSGVLDLTIIGSSGKTVRAFVREDSSGGFCRFIVAGHSVTLL